VKTLVLGIGNPILGDDGVGFHIAQELAKEIKDENIDVEETSVGGLNLLELIVGYDKVIIIDAIMTDSGEVGKVYQLRLEDIGETAQSMISAHHLNLLTMIKLGRELFPKEMPEEVAVLVVGIQEVAKVTEEMTGKVKKAIPRAVNLVLEEMVNNIKTSTLVKETKPL